MASNLDRSLLEKVIYNSAAMQKVRAEVEPLVSSAVPLLFQGESGSGAALYAKAIHEASRAWEFLRISCVELEDDKVKEQLFGTEGERGWLENADNGTIFFRQIEGSSPVIQQTLLQLLRMQSVDGRIEFSRIGTSKRLEVNVRFIYSLAETASTASKDKLLDRELIELIREKGKIIQLPPLRERKEDIIAIAQNFFETLNKQYNQHIESIELDAEKALVNYYWPGNIDKLKQVISDIFAQNPEITSISAAHIPDYIKSSKQPGQRYSFELKGGGQVSGKLLSQSITIKDKAKTRINLANLVEIKRVEDEQFSPPKFKHFVITFKDGNQLIGNIFDESLKVETSFNPTYLIEVKELQLVKIL